MGYISLVDEIQCMLISSCHICIRSIQNVFRKVHLPYTLDANTSHEHVQCNTTYFNCMVLLLQLQFRGHEVRVLGQSGHVVAEGLDSDGWMVVDIGM